MPTLCDWSRSASIRRTIRPKRCAPTPSAFGAQQGRWLFVTGERDALHALIGQGFHLAVADRPESENTDGEGLITHSDRFVLIDRNLQIRGYYHGTDKESVQKLLQDIRELGKERT